MKFCAQSIPLFWTKYQEWHVLLQIFPTLPFYQCQSLNHTKTEMEGRIVYKLQLEFRNLYQGFCTQNSTNTHQFKIPMNYLVYSNMRRKPLS